MGKAPGTRKPTFPPDVWARIEPILVANIGLGKPYKVKDIANLLGIESASVSLWINGKGQPGLQNLIPLLQFLKEDPTELLPEYLPKEPETVEEHAVLHGLDPNDELVREQLETVFAEAKARRQILDNVTAGLRARKAAEKGRTATTHSETLEEVPLGRDALVGPKPKDKSKNG